MFAKYLLKKFCFKDAVDGVDDDDDDEVPLVNFRFVHPTKDMRVRAKDSTGMW